jgi:DNA mismatch repair protein MutS2
LEEFKKGLSLTLSKGEGTSPLNPPKGDLRKVQHIKQTLFLERKSPPSGDLGGFSVGSSVRLKGQTATGTIIEIQDKNAIVAFGQMKSTVKLSKLEAVSNTQLKKEKHKYDSIAQNTNDEVRQRKLTFKSEIDVRGMRVDEALQSVTYFIDDAIMVGITSVRILHGTGTGALRQMIRQYLGTINGVATYRDEHVQFGGAGITVIELV